MKHTSCPWSALGLNHTSLQCAMAKMSHLRSHSISATWFYLQNHETSSSSATTLLPGQNKLGTKPANRGSVSCYTPDLLPIVLRFTSTWDNSIEKLIRLIALWTLIFKLLALQPLHRGQILHAPLL